jgi:transcriptional regulator with XRE-family HTH domain
MQEKKHKFAITVVHLRAARGLLNWSLDELATHAGVTTNTIINWESGRHRPTATTRDRIRAAFERNGVEFLNSGRPGVRMSGATPSDDDSAAHHDDS